MPPILKVAVPAPLPGTFDYLPPPGATPAQLRPGVRLRVPFGRGTRTGVLMGLAAHSQVQGERLKPALEILDPQPLLRETDLQLLQWAARYYHHPIGEVVAAALPALLRQGGPARRRCPQWLCLTSAGREAEPGSNAARQRALLKLLRQHDGVMTPTRLQAIDWPWRPVARALAARGWVEFTTAPPPQETVCRPDFEANPAQRAAVSAITAALGGFTAFLLEGVTGSGKTEVYLQAIEAVLAQDHQALVLLPEIALTPQLQARFQARLGRRVVLYHSGLSAGERLDAWLGLQSGEVPLLLGTRSAVFIPMARPGLIVIDEEHDPSFKQQDGFRFSARDVAVVRARQTGIPIVLGSATPALESVYNTKQGRYRHLTLPHRAGQATPPNLRLLDIRNQRLQAGLAPAACRRIEKVLARGEQVLIFLNRRGYAPTLTCHACGWIAECPRCDARLVLHRRDRRLRCHHCGHEKPPPDTCPACTATDLRPLGHGTERLEEELGQRFPKARIARIDRDATRRKGSLETLLQQVRRGEIDILLGTQMLAKGHHFPNVTLAVILDADAGLYSTDFRAPERLAQLIVQVAGRAGRADKAGEVLIQTRHPQHPLLETLLAGGYPAFAAEALEERRQAGLPPFSHQALLRAEARQPALPLQFLEEAARLAETGLEEVLVLGPVPAPMARRAGHHRAQLLLQSRSRGALHRLLDEMLPRLRQWPQQRRLRWHLEVDPLDLY
ncbi:primosomal protein N' [Methylomarinovum tepidoasis]|uniref:Replication restart protein PriA n=1 Tax=Methylomarinovum tepidoasis TaxID=2840183 RepID=A0AAU9CD58_9GAMM|nr:primosomal protein N' [Methylomarinovum sp. IN45]BCX88741.1 primosomal protein N' [Methylomarinovum sp. IN45]